MRLGVYQPAMPRPCSRSALISTEGVWSGVRYWRSRTPRSHFACCCRGLLVIPVRMVVESEGAVGDRCKVRVTSWPDPSVADTPPTHSYSGPSVKSVRLCHKSQSPMTEIHSW